MTVKVYRYGCGALPRETRNAIHEQVFLAYRYRLMLWHLATAVRRIYREKRAELFPELAHAEAEVERLEAMIELLVEKEDKAFKKGLLQEQRVWKHRVSALKPAANASEELKEASATYKEREGVLRRSLRNVFSQTFGLYSGTYLCTEAADKQARTGKMDPARPRWNGTGILGIQLQGGRAVVQLASGKEPTIRLKLPVRREGRVKHAPSARREGRRFESRTTVSYRLRSQDLKPVMIELPLMVHRDLPKDASVIWAKLAVGRSGERFYYSVQFTVQSEANERKEFGGGTVAICLQGDKIQYAGEGEESKTFHFNPRLEKIASLQSIRDRSRNEIVARMRGQCESEDDLPRWVTAAIDAEDGNGSCRWLVRTIDRIVRKDPIFTEKFREELKAWAYHENHLYQWQSDMRTNALRARKDAYRVWASQLRKKYRHLILDNRRLDAPDRKKFEKNASALDELRVCLRHSFNADFVTAGSGDTCAEMFERFYEEKRLEAARVADVSVAPVAASKSWRVQKKEPMKRPARKQVA